MQSPQHPTSRSSQLQCVLPYRDNFHPDFFFLQLPIPPCNPSRSVEIVSRQLGKVKVALILRANSPRLKDVEVGARPPIR